MDIALPDALVLLEALIFLQQAAHLALERRTGDIGAVGTRVADDGLVYAADFDTAVRPADMQAADGFDIELDEYAAF